MYFTIVGKTRCFMGPSLTIVCQWGNFGALLPPRGTTYTPLRGTFSHSLITSSYVVIYMFLRNSPSELRLVKVGRNALSMRFFGCFIARCTIIVRPIAYKSHSTPFLNRPHDLTPVSWVYTIFECKDIGLAKRLLGYCFWLLGSGLTADSDDIIKAACQYE